MLPTQQREIDGLLFEAQQLDLKVSRATFVRLVHRLGPGLAVIGKGMNGQSILDIDHSAILDALSTLMQGVSEDDLEYACNVFKKRSRVQLEGGLWIQVEDAVFQNKLTTMFKWLGFCLEVNYADFLEPLLAMKARLPVKTPKPSPSPSPAE